jgi:hypothetical protein
MEIAKVIPLLYQSFDIKLEDPDAELKTANAVLNRVTSLRCYLTPRK